MGQITAVVLSLLTIAGSGVVSAIVTHRLSENRSNRDFRLKRLEELFRALQKFSHFYVPMVASYQQFFAGRLTREVALQAQTPASPREVGEALETVEMLVRIYFPRLIGAYNELISARDAADPLLALAMNQEPPNQARATELLQRMRHFHENSEVLIGEIFTEGNRILNSSWWGKAKMFLQEQFYS